MVNSCPVDFPCCEKLLNDPVRIVLPTNHRLHPLFTAQSFPPILPFRVPLSSLPSFHPSSLPPFQRIPIQDSLFYVVADVSLVLFCCSRGDWNLTSSSPQTLSLPSPPSDPSRTLQDRRDFQDLLNHQSKPAATQTLRNITHITVHHENQSWNGIHQDRRLHHESSPQPISDWIPGPLIDDWSKARGRDRPSRHGLS